MHAFLIISNNQQSTINKLTELQKKLSIAKILEFPLNKIEEVRELSKFTRLALNEPTAILLKDIDLATTEALNAFLKNLEEPQEELYYFLTAASLAKVLPTITSRCQIIKVKSEKLIVNSGGVEKFLKMGLGEKFAYVDKIRDRQEAKDFVESLIYETHRTLHEKDGDVAKMAKFLEAEMRALSNLNANGNVTLQLANLALNLS